MTTADQIFNALETEDLSSVRTLLNEQPDLVKAENRLGQTPFWLASCMGFTRLVEIMLEEPCRSYLQHDKPDQAGRTALDAARAYNNDEVIRILEPVFAAGTEASEQTPAKSIPILIAIRAWVQRQASNLAAFVEDLRPSVVAGSAAAVAIAVLVAVLVLNLSQHGTSIEDMVASGGDGSLDKAIRLALSKTESDYERHQELFTRLDKMGWEFQSISRQLVGRNTAAGLRTDIICQISFQGPGETLTRTIEVKNIGTQEVAISHNFYDFPKILNEFKNRIVATSINICI